MANEKIPDKMTALYYDKARSFDVRLAFPILPQASC